MSLCQGQCRCYELLLPSFGLGHLDLITVREKSWNGFAFSTDLASKNSRLFDLGQNLLNCSKVQSGCTSFLSKQALITVYTLYFLGLYLRRSGSGGDHSLSATLPPCGHCGHCMWLATTNHTGQYTQTASTACQPPKRSVTETFHSPP